MDKRLLMDYMRRWFVLYITFCYSAFTVFVGLGGDFQVYSFLSNLICFIYCLYFGMELFQLGTLGTLRALPVEKSRYARTVWFECVLLPGLVAFSVYCLAYIGLAGFVSPPFHIITQIPFHAIKWLAFCSSYFIVLTIFMRLGMNFMKGFVLGIFLIGYFIGVLLLFHQWETSESARLSLTAATFMLLVASYRCAPRMVDMQIGFEKIVDAAPTVNRHYHNQDVSIRFMDRWLAHHFLSKTVISFLLVAICVSVLQYKPIIEQYHVVIVGFIAFIAVTLFVFVVLLYQRELFVGSIRLFGSLPVSRRKLYFLFLLLPVMVYLPVALLSWFGMEVSLRWFFLIVAITWFGNALEMQWGWVAFIFFVNVMAFLFTFRIYLNKNQSLWNDPHFWMIVDYVILGIGLIIAALWIRFLLYKSSAPYRNKPSWGGCC